jgi:hypothetical protein
MFHLSKQRTQEIAATIQILEMITKMEVSSPLFVGVPSLSSMTLMNLEEYIMIPNLIGTPS